MLIEDGRLTFNALEGASDPDGGVLRQGRSAALTDTDGSEALGRYRLQSAAG